MQTTFELQQLQARGANRIVCWYSCGAASAVATKLTISANSLLREPLPLVVVRCLVDEEHEDNDRFTKDCEKWFDNPVQEAISEVYGSSIYGVFSKRRYISGIAGAPCTLELKKRIREKFQQPNDIHVMGYCSEEIKRFDRFLDANADLHVLAPLVEEGLTHSDALGMLSRYGIEIPAMYKLGYNHNNCIGCVKSTGAGYWNKIRDDFPEQFNKMAAFSRTLSVRLIKIGKDRVYLDELPRGIGRYQDEPEVQCGAFCELKSIEIDDTKN